MMVFDHVAMHEQSSEARGLHPQAGTRLRVQLARYDERNLLLRCQISSMRPYGLDTTQDDGAHSTGR